MDYKKLMTGLVAEMKKGVQYKRIPSIFRIFLIIAMIPFIISTIVSIFVYYVALFFHKALSAPADYLQKWLKSQKDDVQHATQAVLYFVSMPFIFFLQILLAFNSFFFFFQWFVIMVNGYLLTLGGIKWQPIIMEATFEETDDSEYTLAPGKTAAITYCCLIFGCIALSAFLVLLGVIGTLLGAAEMMTIIIPVVGVLYFVYWVLAVIVNPLLFKRKKNVKNQ